MKARKTFVSFLLGIVMSIALIFGVIFALPTSKPTTKVEAAATYTTKDVAMMGSVAGWYGNGNGEIRLTLGECDWAGESGEKSFDTSLGLGDLPTLLKNLGFFDHIQVGGKTLAEWGCTSCYGNIYWLNSGEPKYTIMIPIAMGADNMAAATAAGVGTNSRLTILEGALIPSYAYLQGNASATIYRAGCDFVTQNAGVAYDIMSVGKTEVESIKYVQGHDGTCGYVGVSLKGDDYAGDGVQKEATLDSYQSSEYLTNHFENKILVNGVGGKTNRYGLFNLGSKGKGYYSFAFYATEAESETITIPAGTLFPSYAMTNLRDINGNPVYIMYETQTDVTFYKQADDTWQKPYVDKETSVSSAKVTGSESDNFTVISLTNHDYLETLDNYGGTAVETKAILANSNFYTKVLVNDVAVGSTSEAYVNVWGNKGAFAIRTSTGLKATKITILSGCQFPSYAELLTGDKVRYVTTEDVTFVKNANGEWVKYIPEGDFDTAVSLVQFGRSTNVLNINLSENDYPAPDGNNAATYNIGVGAEKILSLNLFDNIIVDGYTLRSRYSKHGAASASEPWIWINKFVGHNFAVKVPNENGEKLTPNKIVIRAGAQFPSMAYINNDSQAFYVTTEEVTYVRVSDNVETSWAKQAKITFKADNKTIASLPYTVENGIDGEIPEVPEKSGCKGTWESYTLNGNDIVVNATYTAHGFTEIETNISKMEYKEGFLVVFLTNHDYAGAGTKLFVNDKVANVHFFNFVEIDGIMAATQPTKAGDAYLNVWGGYEGAFATYLPCAAPTQKVVLKKGCQIPSNAYRLDGNNKTCYVLTEDVTFLNENGTWVRQSNASGDEVVSSKPQYDNDYILSDLYHTSHALSTELQKGYLYVDKETTDGNVYGYNASQSFSLTFDFSLNIGNNDLSAQGNYTVFDISMATRGYSSSHGFGWRFYLYRPDATEKCVELHCTPGAYAGNIKAYTELGLFEKGETYRVTLGYKLLDEKTGTVETYINVDGWETKESFVLGADYINFARNVDSISFSTTSAIANGVRISDPDLEVGKETPIITLTDGDKAIVSERAIKYTLPELNAYECGKPNEVFVGWSVDEKLYSAGYELELTGDTTLNAVWIGFDMRNGAAVRKTGDSGLRFLVDVNGAAYEAALNANLIVETGTLVVPTNYLDNGIAFVHESFSEGYFLDISTETWTTKTGDTWTYAAALVNISPAQYARSMSARGYLKVAYTNGEGYIYTAYSKDLHARSVYSVATSAYNDNVKLDSVLNYVNSVADITIDGSFEATKTENSVGAYTVSSVKDGSTYTLTFDKGVKALSINGVRMLAGYTAEIVIAGQVCEVSGYKLSSNGLTATFTVEEIDVGDMTSYYEALAESYKNSEDYTELHKNKIDSILDTWTDYSNAATNASKATKLARIKTQTELQKDVGDTKLATPVVTYGLGYTVTWNAVDDADYYFVTDDNDYRDGVYVLATEELVYKTEVVGKHNVTVKAYSYYEEFACSDESAKFATIEVKPVFSYKAMSDGLYKFSKSDMGTMGLDNNLNTKNDGSSFYYDSDAKMYFAYYNKYTGWSKNQGYATDWTSPAEFPAHAARLKAMGNNVILIGEDSAASFKADSVWETSRTKYIMDTAWSMGMKVIVCDDVLLPLSKTVGSQSEAATAIANRSGFTDYVQHPAFFGFALEDEPEKDEVKNVGYMIKALKAACANLGYSKANGNEPFFLACLYQKNIGFSTIWNYDNYLQSWVDETGLDYIYVDLYTGHAMGDSTNRYTTTYEAVYKSGLGVIEGNVQFHQVITAHTQNKGTEGKLTDQDLYMSMLYAAAHNLGGYSWFCYFPISGETAGSMVGFNGKGYGNGIGNGAESGKSYYDAAKIAGYQFELIQGVMNGYKLKSRSYSSNLLTTTLSNGSNTITMYVNADTQSLSATPTVTASGSVCYLVGYGVGTAEAPYEVISGSRTLLPGQAVICVA